MKFVPVPITGGPSDGKTVLFSVWETRVKDFEAFVKDTKWDWSYKQSADHPVTRVDWEDAVSFCKWLTEGDRKQGRIGPKDFYRLPTDHEWSCAVGVGKDEDPAAEPAAKSGKVSAFPWGKDFPPGPRAGNYSGEERKGKTVSGEPPIAGFNDGFTGPARWGRSPHIRVVFTI